MTPDQYPLYSVLICTLAKRAESLARLMAQLEAQKAALEPGLVEIITDPAPPPVTIGEKRNRLLTAARGDFVAFVDDDDAVADDYLARIVGAIRADPTIDCVGIEGVMTRDGINPKRFVHTIKCGAWYEEDGVYFRCCNHWNPVRREHALRARFPLISWGEDQAYSYALRDLGVLKKETFLNGCIYKYLFSPDGSEAVKYMPKGR